MTAFQFRALDADRRTITGAIEAASHDEALLRLRAKGALPISIEPQQRTAGFGRRAPKTLGAATEHALFGDLAVLLKAGLTLDQALDLASTTIDGAANRRLAASLRDRVRSGCSFSAALVDSPVSMGPITLALIRAGEASGQLADAASRLAELAGQRQKAGDKLRSALGYPVMVLIASGLTIVFLLIVVVPAFTPMFGAGGAPMPESLANLLSMRDLLANHGPLLLVVLAVFALLLQHLSRLPVIRSRLDRFLLTLPWIGSLLAAVELARFSRSFGGLLEAGMPLASALPLARATLRNRTLAGVIEQAGEAVRAGRDLSAALAEAPGIPPLVGHLLRVSEAAGQPAPMLLRIAVLSEREVERKTARLLTLLPTVLIIAMGSLVAWIVTTLLGAVLDVNQLAF